MQNLREIILFQTGPLADVEDALNTVLQTVGKVAEKVYAGFGFQLVDTDSPIA